MKINKDYLREIKDKEPTAEERIAKLEKQVESLQCSMWFVLVTIVSVLIARIIIVFSA